MITLNDKEQALTLKLVSWFKGRYINPERPPLIREKKYLNKGMIADVFLLSDKLESNNG